MSNPNFIFLRRLHGRIYEWKLRIKKRINTKRYYIDQYKRKKNAVFFVLTPHHTNLGDHAIAKSIIELLHKNNYDYVEVTYKQLENLRELRLLTVFNKYPIIISGGGNLGTLWFDVEQMMRDIISSNPKSHIFIYPNTVFYEDSEWGKIELEHSKKLYNSHKHLHIYAREHSSYQYMLPIYRDVKLVPDMVLSQNECDGDETRSGCLICLRNDREKTIDESEINLLMSTLTTVFNKNINFTDTHSAQNVSSEERNQALELKYSEFRSAELVITDRLHGMIFCAITGTPCIVVNSKSPKVLGCYEWIKKLEYVKFCDDINKVVEIYNSIPKKKYYYDNTMFNNYYSQLSEDLNKYLTVK